MIITPVPMSNDFHFQEIRKGRKGSDGYIRAVLLKGNIYIVQGKYDDPVYYLSYYEFT